MKLIDKDSLVAMIENRIKELQNFYKANEKKLDSIQKDAKLHYIGENKVILSLIDTLEVKEVDLKEYYIKFLQKEWFGNSHVRTVSEMMAFIAEHFFELGLSYSVNESIVRKIVDLYFEASKHYDEVIKQERNENGGSQLAIDILDGSKDMKELCVQYVLDKVTKE